MQYLQNLNKSYSVIATHKAAILETLKLINQRFNIHFRVIARFMKGLYVSKPPFPRYQVTWDVSKVLRLLSTWKPNEALSFKMLTLKLTALFALAVAARAQTIISIKIQNIRFADNKVIINCGDKLKGRKPGVPLFLEIHKFDNVDLCPVRILECYLRKSKHLRKSDQLLISFVTYKAISTSTVARWLKMVLFHAGIDVNIFKAHSFRVCQRRQLIVEGVL